MAVNILSGTSRVEVPFIVVQIGDYTFGMYDKTKVNLEREGKYYAAIKITYPNYMESLQIAKVNGNLNSYTLTLVYPITEVDDPNLIDRVLSTVSSSRKIKFTYGDCSTSTFLYKDEEALITDVRTNIDIGSSRITYTIKAVSSSMTLASAVDDFPRYENMQPSELILALLREKSLGLTDVFYGMQDVEKVQQLKLIPRTDKSVTIEARSNINVLDYLNYLVSCMISTNDKTNTIQGTAQYVLTVHDDISDKLDGPYFKITELQTQVASNSSIDEYVIDIGYPNKELVSNFTIDDDQAYAILYKYSKKVDRKDYVYRIDDSGALKEIFSPAISNSSQLLETTAADRNWWSQMTQFPIHATLTIKGLLRSAVLMSYIRVNVYFYGRKHSSSGLYVITKQVDSVSKRGYSTTLSLVRVGGSDQNT